MDSPFLADLETALNAVPASIHENELLEDLEGWDSLGVLAVISMVQANYGVGLEPSALMECRTAGNLAALIGLSRNAKESAP